MTSFSVPFASPGYFFTLALLLIARGLDFFSTWVATPNLALEGNPLAKKMGWKWGAVVNLILCLAFALFPLSAIIVSTTSVLVAARNFRSAGSMRSMGEEGYRQWMTARLTREHIPLYFVCMIGEVVLTAAVGLVLVHFCDPAFIPFGIGVGIISYALVIFIYSSLTFFRIFRHSD